jgi:hypothetical protein
MSREEFFLIVYGLIKPEQRFPPFLYNNLGYTCTVITA